MMDSEMDAGPPLNDPDQTPELESLPMITTTLISPAGDDLAPPTLSLHPKRKLSQDLTDLLEPKRHRGIDNPQINPLSLITATENFGGPSSFHDAVEALTEIHEDTHNGVTQKEGEDSEKVEKSSSDAFKEELNSILGDNGGLKLPQHVPRLDILLSNEQGLKHRWTLLTVVELSSKECQRCLIQGNGLKTLERWLVEAREANKPQFLSKVIECVSALPVDVGMLKKCTMGKTIGLLRRHDFLAVRQAAKGLIDKWKGLINKFGSDRPKVKDPPTSEKGSLFGQGEKKSGKAVKPMKSGPKVVNVAKLVAVDDSQMFNPTPPPRRPRKVVNRQKSPAGQNPSQKQITSSVVRAMVSGLGTISGDNKDTSSISLMSVQGKVDPTRMQDLTILSPLTTVQMKEPEQSPPTNSSEVLGSQIHQPESVVHTSLSEDMKDFKPSQDDGDAAELSGQPLPSTGASNNETERTTNTQIDAMDIDPDTPQPGNDLHCPQQIHQTRNSSKDQSIPLNSANLAGNERNSSQTESLKLSLSGSNLPIGPGTIIGKSGLLRLGGLCSDEMVSSENRVGSISAPFLPQRAPSGGWESTNAKVSLVPMQAPSPEVEVRRSSKRKRVSWASEEQLTSTRWFKRDDPPDCVKQDAFYTPEEFAAQEYLEARHNPFSSAARLEHLNESEAIKESKRQESQECTQSMVRRCPWKQPPALLLNPDWKVAFGEGSKEKSVQSRREEDVVAMRNAKNTIIPSNPMEPEPEPVHQGQTNIIPYNAPKVQGHEAAKNQPVRVQEQAAAPQPINEGFTMALEQPKNSVSSMQQGFIAQNTFVPQQVIQQPSGQPQTVLVLQSSTARPPVLMPVGASQPMLMAQRTNQAVLAAPHRQLLISGHPQSMQVQAPAMHYQMAPGSFLAARPPGMVQQLVISGQDPSIALQQNQFGQQVFTVPGGMLQANVRAQTMLAPRMMPQGHRLPKPANSVPSWRP